MRAEHVGRRFKRPKSKKVGAWVPPVNRRARRHSLPTGPGFERAELARTTVHHDPVFATSTRTTAAPTSCPRAHQARGRLPATADPAARHEARRLVADAVRRSVDRDRAIDLRALLAGGHPQGVYAPDAEGLSSADETAEKALTELRREQWLDSTGPIRRRKRVRLGRLVRREGIEPPTR